MLLAKAQEVAEKILEAIAPYVHRAEIAGSVRRGKPEVKDIEIVCIPRIQEAAIDLFGEATDTRNLLDNFITEQLSMFNNGTDEGAEGPALHIRERLDKNGREAVGSRYKRLLYLDIAETYPLDLFAVIPPAEWGAIFAIRTGPADYSHRFVTQRSKGGLLPDHMRVYQGALWVGSTNGEPGTGIWHTPEERDFFEAIALKYIEPWERR